MPVSGFDEGKNKEDVYKTSEVTTLLSNKVDKVSGKGLSTNDYTTAEKAQVATIQNKVDKVSGKQLSTNDYTTAEKNLVATISGKQNQHTKATVNLPASGWNNKSLTVSVSGVTASNTVLVSPAPASVAAYAAAGIICTAQGAGNLTFTCDFTPASDISVNVVILGV